MQELLIAALAACLGGQEGRFDGLGPAARDIGTSSREAQGWFNQGLAFLFAFNHDEAIRSFERAAKADPAHPMPWWGIAYAHGPHINNPAVDEPRAKAAWAALSKALERIDSARQVDRDLIRALSARYADPQPEDRSGLDKAYAEAMRTLWSKHPGDADVGALLAEALMDVHPWDLYTAEGKPKEWTLEITALLEKVMAMQADHPLALHLYIHAVEASEDPGKATAAADRLRELCPGLGHLVHMPSHIDVRTGEWKKASAANVKAIAADKAYVAKAHAPGFYRLYMTHNHHMRVFAAMMRGREGEATASVREMRAAIPADWMAVKENQAIIDGFLGAPFEVHLRFGRWEAMLKEPEPAAEFPLARALWRFARAASLGALGRTSEAREEQKRFLEAKAGIPKEAFFGNNVSSDVAAVAERVLEGEILAHEGRLDESARALREAVEREDALRYDEPPDWIQPSRHSLGAVLLKAGQASEAEAVYRKDLRTWPNNGWSLYGLARALKAQGKDASEVEARFEAAWADADVELSSSCLCLPAK